MSDQDPRLGLRVGDRVSWRVTRGDSSWWARGTIFGWEWAVGVGQRIDDELFAPEPYLVARIRIGTKRARRSVRPELLRKEGR